MRRMTGCLLGGISWLLGWPAAVSPAPAGGQTVQIWNPCWSSDGRILFEASLDGDGVMDIYALSPDGSGLVRLHEKGQNPVASPDGRRIVFTGQDAEGDLEIYAMAADGSDVRQITDNGSVDYGPAWTPDGKSVVFNSKPEPKGYVHTLWMVGADGAEPRRLGSDPVNSLSPTVSPDGRQIAFVRGEWPRLGLWVMPSEGGEARQLVERGFTPEWSRDGRRIVFQGFAGERPEIFEVDPASGVARRLTRNDFDDGMPSWSPDGKRIVFVSQRGGGAGLWAIDADGSGERLLLSATQPPP